MALYALSTGCFGGSNNNGSTTSNGGSTSNSTDTSAATSSGSNTGGANGTGPFTDDNVVLDDMTMQQSVTGGSWYTYSDRSVPNSEPPIIGTPVPPGFVAPTEGQSFFADQTGPIINDAGWPARMADGGGENTWGAGFGLDITSKTPDGTQVAFNTCDAGTIFDTSPDASSVGIPQPYDASAYTGIGFYANSPGGTVVIEVHVDDKKTSPWGGMCNACVSSGTCMTALGTGLAGCPCSDNYIQKVSVGTGWKHYEVHWRQMATANWSKSKTFLPGDGGMDPTAIYNFHFQFTTNAGKALPGFSVQVAYLTWLKD
jgi:hypothetical protein